MKTYTLTMEWGQSDEGLYHWAGRARNEDEAIQLAREEMDATYNEEYNKDEPVSQWRGKDSGDETTEYVCCDSAEGVNEYAAADMLSALKLVASSCSLTAEVSKAVQDAIARGEGRA